MIVYFANRNMEIMGKASTNLRKGVVLVDDDKVEDVETGVATFECSINVDEKHGKRLEAMAEPGNYLLRKNGRKNEFYTIIDSEYDTKKREVWVYAEDAGLDLLNEIAGEYAAVETHDIEYYVEYWTRDSGFEIGINECSASTTRKLSWDGESTVTERLASIATQFGGYEISFSFEIKCMEVTHKYINIYKQRGKDVGVQLRLNRDIDRIITKKSVANLATAFRCIGGTPEDSEVPISLKGYKYDDGDFFVGEDGGLRSRNAAAKWSRYVWNKEPNKLDGYAGHIWRNYSYDTTSQQTLCSHAITELKKVCDMEVNYEVEISKLSDGVEIGDRVSIIDDAGELYLSSRILKLSESETRQEHTATIGEHLIKDSGINQKVADLAAQFAVVAAERKQEFEKVLAFESDIRAAQEAAAEAKEQAEAAVLSADEAKIQADAAEKALAAAEGAMDEAVSKAESALTIAEGIEAIADEAKQQASEASSTAAAAKQDAQQAVKDIAALGENLETLSHTMSTDYARKTDLTESEAKLQTKIDQNAGQISSTASKVAEIDETVNEAAEQAQQAQQTAGSAMSKADAAQAEADAAKIAANNANTAAQQAQTAANNATTAAQNAQAAVDEANENLGAAEAELEAAKSNLAAVTSRVDATEEEIAAAQAAADKAKTDAANAQAAADKAKSDAAAAQMVADTAKTAANNAQAAANAAQDAADKAQADVNALAVRMVEAETKIVQTAEKIDLMATKKEVTETLGGYYTKSEAEAMMQIKADGITSMVNSTFATKGEVDAIEIGGRNLALKTAESRTATGTGIENEVFMLYRRSPYSLGCFDGGNVSISFDWETTATSGTFRVQENNTPWEGFWDQRVIITADNQSGHMEGVSSRFTEASNESTWSAWNLRLDGVVGDVTISNLKIEKGNKPTDWTPAPEDMATGEDVDNVAQTAGAAQETASDAAGRVTSAESVIQQLADAISMIVVDENGTTLMEQTSEGWSFNLADVTASLVEANDAINSLDEKLGTIEGDSVGGLIKNLEQLVDDLKTRTAYIDMKTDSSGNPYMELGKRNDDEGFKLAITNSTIDFKFGSAKTIQLENRNGVGWVIVDRLVVDEELWQGNFVWLQHSGSLGLLWKEGAE